MSSILGTLIVTGILLAGGGAAIVYAGLINVGADEPHSPAVHAFLETVRDRSIAARAASIAVPELVDEQKIRAGSGNYAAMCADCHLAPGQGATELSSGLYPPPPDFAGAEVRTDPARAFWVIKHGIKSTGMPAWGGIMEDRYIWEIVAFLQRLPALDSDEYRVLVASSDGHQHGGDESESGHAAEAESTDHVHADGKVHVH